jgi:hypothetical protein
MAAPLVVSLPRSGATRAGRTMAERAALSSQDDGELIGGPPG